MKDLKISKELLSEVLKKEIENRDISYVEIYKNVVIYKVSIYDREEEINIYELAHKCKEWARDKYNITISSALYSNYAKSWNVDKDKSYTAKTEVEVIIKACEWILENIK